MSELRWGRIVLAALGVKVLMVAMAFAWVAIYSHGIDPGHEHAYYEAYAQRASPWVAVIVGGPLMAAGVWLATRRIGRRWAHALAIFGVAIAVDLPVHAYASNFASIALPWLLVVILSFAGARAGAALAALGGGIDGGVEPATS